MKRVNDFSASYVHTFLSKSFLEKVLVERSGRPVFARVIPRDKRAGPLLRSAGSELTGRLPVVTGTDTRRKIRPASGNSVHARALV